MTADLIPDGTADQRHELARTFGHQDIKQCCALIAGRQPTAPRPVALLVEQLRHSPLLVAVSGAFCDLQEARHQADYDHRAAMSKPTVVALVDDAERAARDFANVPTPDRQAFAVMVAIRARTQKR